MTLADLDRTTSAVDESTRSSSEGRSSTGPEGSPIYQELVAELGDPTDSAGS